MDFSLNDEQREWQAKARKFAQEEIRPISLARDATEDPAETFDWDIIRKGSKLGFRTMAVPKEWGGRGTDFVTQALVMTELAKADSAISKAFSQCWKWSHLIAASCTDEQKERFLRPFLADDTFVLGKGISEHSAGSDNRLPPKDDPKAGLKLRAERRGDEWILNGEKAFIANGNIGKLFFIDARTDPNAPLKQGTTMFLVPRDTPGFRTGKVYNKSGWRFYQNGEMIFENARVPHANVVGEVNGAVKKSGGAGGDTTGGDLFGDLELAANALGICDDACEVALKHARSREAGREVSLRAAARSAQVEPHAHADRGAALLCHAHRLGARPQDPLAQRGPRDEFLDRCRRGSDRALHGPARRRGLRDGRARRQARARCLHLAPPRRRHGAAAEGRGAARDQVAGHFALAPGAADDTLLDVGSLTAGPGWGAACGIA